MIWSRRFGRRRVTLSCVKFAETAGMSSKLKDGHHILFWDFDKISIEAVFMNLKETQKMFNLSSIYILKSNPENGYHAICLSRHTWLDAIHIITSCMYIDEEWLRSCIVRRYFMLRIGQKHGSYPKPFMLIESKKSEVPISEIVNFDRYEIFA